MKNSAVVVCAVIGIVLIISAIVGTKRDQNKDQPGVQNNQPQPVQQPTVRTSAIVIFTDFQSNEIAAEAKYKGKIVQLSGVVDKIGSTFSGAPYITLYVGLPGQPNNFWVQCEFPEKDKAKLAALSPFTPVNVVGKCIGKLGHVFLEDCRLVEKASTSELVKPAPTPVQNNRPDSSPIQQVAKGAVTVTDDKNKPRNVEPVDGTTGPVQPEKVPSTTGPVQPEKVPSTTAPAQPETVQNVPKPIEVPSSSDIPVRDFPQPVLKKQIGPEKNGKFLRNRIFFLALSKNGEKLVTASRDDNSTTVWDLVAGKPVHLSSGRFKSVAIDKDGKWFLGASLSNPNSCEMCKLGNDKAEYRSLQGHSDEVSAVAVTDDAKWVVTGCRDGSTKLWEVSSGKENRTFPAPKKGEVTSVVISSDAKWIITAIKGNGTSSAHLWDVESGKEVRAFEGQFQGVRSMALSADDKWLVIGSINGISLWDVATATNIRSFTSDGTIISAALSADGKWLATCSSYDSNVARLFDVATGNQVKMFSGHVDWVFDVAFTNDSKRLVTGSTDGTTRFWELSTGKQLFTLVGFSHRSWAVFDFQGRFDGSNDGKFTGLTWPLKRQDYYTPGLLSKLTRNQH